MENGTEKPLTKRERRELARESKTREREKEKKANVMRKICIWGLVILAVGFFGYKLFKYLSAPVDNVDIFEIAESEWVKGAVNARATLIEYSDYQCPACKSITPLLERLVNEFPNDLRLVFRDFPLTTIHKYALPAAKAAEASGKQGKYWEMHDVLFDKQEEWATSGDSEKFNRYALDLGLNVDNFKSDYDSKIVEEAVKKDIVSGGRLRINSTPALYLNGKKLTVESYEQLKREVEKVILR